MVCVGTNLVTERRRFSIEQPVPGTCGGRHAILRLRTADGRGHCSFPPASSTMARSARVPWSQASRFGFKTQCRKLPRSQFPASGVTRGRNRVPNRAGREVHSTQPQVGIRRPAVGSEGHVNTPRHQLPPRMFVMFEKGMRPRAVDDRNVGVCGDKINLSLGKIIAVDRQGVWGAGHFTQVIERSAPPRNRAAGLQTPRSSRNERNSPVPIASNSNSARVSARCIARGACFSTARSASRRSRSGCTL